MLRGQDVTLFKGPNPSLPNTVKPLRRRRSGLNLTPAGTSPGYEDSRTKKKDLSAALFMVILPPRLIYENRQALLK